ncbi:hypothetical protein BV20DRAFT_1114602 [Pilatotrama ljubarskyi]|nr:hypothetical protein BV20DRAFT_1114602 [Pilatotrama ljubarskyi]
MPTVALCTMFRWLLTREDHTGTRGIEPSEATNRRKRDIRDSRDYMIGPMPVVDFLDEFLPAVPADRQRALLSSKGAFKNVPTSAATPSALIEPMIAALNRFTKHKSHAPGFVFMATSERSEYPHKPGYMKPHICCFASQNASIVQRSAISSRAELGYAEFFVEVKPDIALDFFVDPPSKATREELASHDFAAYHEDERLQARINRALGQHLAYATEVLARQHRAFLFSVSMSGSSARLLRWDRSGVIVTQSFDVRQEPDLLCDFVGRFACASDVQRGHDLTVEMATPGEDSLFREVITTHVREQSGLHGDGLAKAVKEHYEPGHVTAVHVFSVKTDSSLMRTERYLVSRPVTNPLSLTGRATRGYWAVQSSTGRPVFLKDTWRLAQELEGDVISSLLSAGVRYVPEVVAHGHVPAEPPSGGQAVPLSQMQLSRAERYDTKPWVSAIRGEMNSLSTQIHYRLVLGSVGYELKHFRGTDELLRATYDVYHAMLDALRKCSRIHRDISTRNIILVREGDGEARRGYLVDWECSSKIDDKGQALESGRDGTWRYMSMGVLLDPKKRHVFQDDMESLLYVILHCAVLYLPHDLTSEDLREFMHQFFHRSVFMRGALHGGDAKLANSQDRILTRMINFENADLREWLDTVMDYHGPPVHLEKEMADHWTDPTYLDNFWGTFLKERSLPRDDRIEHELIYPGRFPDETPGSEVPSTPPKPSATKRKAEVEAAPSIKSPRTDYRATPRRSERLRGRSDGAAARPVRGNADTAPKQTKSGRTTSSSGTLAARMKSTR